MKREVLFFWSSLLILLGTACQQESSSRGFTVQIAIQNTNPGWCYLYRLPLNSDPVAVDSFNLLTLDASFELHDAAMDTACLYQLTIIPARASIYLVSDTGRVHLQLNAVDPFAYAIDGSEESKALQQIQRLQKGISDSLYIVNNKLQNGIGNPAIWQEEARILQRRMAANYRVFADTVSQPLAALFIGQQVDFGKDLVGQKTFVDHLMQRFPENAWVASHVRGMNAYFSLLETEYQIGDTIPVHNFTDIQGKKQNTARWKGKPYLLEFGASYCPPCLVSLHQKKAVYQKYAGSEFEMLAFSLDTDSSMLNEAFSSSGFPFPVVADRGGWTGVAAQTYKIDSIPFNFLIGVDGRVVEKNISAEKLESYLEKQRGLE